MIDATPSKIRSIQSGSFIKWNQCAIQTRDESSNLEKIIRHTTNKLTSSSIFIIIITTPQDLVLIEMECKLDNRLLPAPLTSPSVVVVVVDLDVWSRVRPLKK